MKKIGILFATLLLGACAATPQEVATGVAEGTKEVATDVANVGANAANTGANYFSQCIAAPIKAAADAAAPLVSYGVDKLSDGVSAICENHDNPNCGAAEEGPDQQ